MFRLSIKGCVLLQHGDRTEGEPDWMSESWEHVLQSAGKMAAMGPEGWTCWWEGGKQWTSDTEEGKSAEVDFGQAKRVREKEKETSKTRLWSVKLDW